jgi:hypothetical protein
MKANFLLWVVLLLLPARAWALSEGHPRPAIFFAKGGDTNRQELILSVLRADGLKYLSGLTSYWEPDFGTTLVYDSDAEVLESVLAKLSAIEGLTLKISFSRDLAKETGSVLSAGTWWVKYRHTEPNTIEIRLNTAAEDFHLERLRLWVAKRKGK